MIKERNSGNVVAQTGTWRVGSGAYTPITAVVSGKKEWMSTLTSGQWPRSDVDNGSPWDHKLVSFDSPVTPAGSYGRGGNIDLQLHYIGGAVCKRVFGTETNFISSNPAPYGAEAYNRMKPTKPAFEAAVSIGELRELPSQIMQRYTRDLRGISNFYVALQFGWAPLLRDTRFLVTQQRMMQKKLEQLIRDNGRPVRRRTTIRSSDPDFAYFSPAGAFDGYAYLQGMPTNTRLHISPPKYEQWYKETTRIWASARFKYYLPPGPRSILWRRSVLAKLCGLYPSPAMVWNLLPWTWLVDWFGNVGTVLENMDAGAASRLAADYFYVMGEVRQTYNRKLTVYPYYYPTLGGPPVVATGTDTRLHQVRLRGNPFGLAGNDTSLSDYQLSILGALGYSRLSGRP